MLRNLALSRRVRLRFASITTAKVGLGVTFVNLFNTQIVATTATAGYLLYDAVKIKSVEVWASGSAAAPVSVSVQFPGSSVWSTGDFRVFSDTSIGVAEPAHVRAFPAKDSTACLWHNNTLTTEVAFALTCPIGAIVDVECEFRNNYDGSAAVAASSALAGASAGTVYQRGLDGLPFASTTLYPQGITGVI